MNDDFIVGRNPDPESSLPYVVRLPIDGGLWFKAKADWPRASRVYCHPCEPIDEASFEIRERVSVQICIRRGPAIDLILQRAQNKRSQFVFTTFRGRPMIFWQTAKAAAAARPGLRVPFAPAAASHEFIVDTRERYGYTFRTHAVTLIRRALPVGDYALERGGIVVAAVERKTLGDFTVSLNDGTLNLAMAELASLRHAAVVVEGSYSGLLRNTHTRPGYLVDVCARLQVRYAAVPVVFAETRKIAEEWTFRFLRAAEAMHDAPDLGVTPPR